jgi:anti-anti-sigma factor
MSNRTFAATVRQPMLQLQGSVIIDLHGEINSGVEAVLNQAYADAEAVQPETIILNFSAVDYINSTGIALIVALLARARKAKRTLAVFGLSEHYQEIFAITRLSDFMQIFNDESSVISSIASNELKSGE